MIIKSFDSPEKNSQDNELKLPRHFALLCPTNQTTKFPEPFFSPQNHFPQFGRQSLYLRYPKQSSKELELKKSITTSSKPTSSSSLYSNVSTLDISQMSSFKIFANNGILVNLSGFNFV